MTALEKIYATLQEGNTEKSLELLKAEILKANAKKNGTTKELTLIKNVFKSAKKINKGNELLQMGHTFEFNGNKYTGYTDSHYILASTETFGIEQAEEGKRYKMENMFKPDWSFDDSYVFDREDIKNFISLMGKEVKPYIVETPKGKIGLNPKMLLDCIDFTKTSLATFTFTKGNNTNCHIAPIQFESSDDERKNIALLLPINIKD